MKLLARRLLDFNTDQLWDKLKGNFTLVFDDGEIETNSRETIYSHFTWIFHQRYKTTPLLKAHHVSCYISKNRLSNSTHIDLLQKVMWDCYDAQIPTIFMTPQTQGLVDELARLVYQTSNRMYNELSYNLEHAVASLDIVDFIQVLEHPKIKAVLDNVQESQQYIDDCYKVIDTELRTSLELANNPLARSVKAKLLKKNQLLQCLGPRGYLTDIDSHIFGTPITRGYVKGFRSFYHSLIESRSSAKSLFFAQADLQNSEYFSRRLQLLCETVQNLHPGDCGSTNYLMWHVNKGDIESLIGKFYFDDDTKSLKVIRESDKHLEGKTLKLRSVVAGCSHPDPRGICSTCFGELSLHIPENTNIGQICSSSLAQKISQMILSAKHFDGSSVVERIILSQDETNFLKVNSSGDGYCLPDSLFGANVSLVVSQKEATGLTDIMQTDDVHKLGISRISEIDMIAIVVSHKEYQERVPIVVSRGKRKANLTYELLEYIKENGWKVDERDNYVIDLSDWPENEVLMSLPAIHFNMSDVGNQIAGIIESSIEKSKKNEKVSTPESTLFQLYEVTQRYVRTNLAVLEVILFGGMVVSNKNRDYRLPKTFTNKAMGVSKVIIKNRSLAAAMAYEDQPNVMTDPESFIKENRPSHPMDVFLCPRETVLDPKRR